MFTVVPLAEAKDRIARALLPGAPNGLSAGRVALWPHQRDAVARLAQIIARHRGALLADDVGLGKTYTALAVARSFTHVEIVAPAALRAMWHEACARCAVPAHFVSAESLSRGAPADSAATLIVVDEAHWFRNPATRRYRHLARRSRDAAVLLLSATPLHNRPSDVTALLALFAGKRAERLLPNELAELVVRRGREAVTVPQASLPEVAATRWWRMPADAALLAALERLEPPVPLRDAELALALLRLTLFRRLASSMAALRVTLRRMLARALALLDALRAGRYPTERELRSWLVSEEAVQLALPGLLAEWVTPNEALRGEHVERHIASLRGVLRAVAAAADTDRRRAAVLAELLRRFPEARIVAFSQYDATVRALARLLRRENGVAVLSGRGCRIASGPVPRAEVLRQFDAGQRVSSNSMRVKILLSTDLLSEGVNLHNANVVVHLDLPWSPARLQQRVGRVSRLGSPHRRIHVFGFAPPACVERLQRNVARLRVKWRAARRHFGESPLLSGEKLVQLGSRTTTAYTNDRESVLALLHEWLAATTAAPRADEDPVAAYATIERGASPSALALVHSAGTAMLLAVTGRRVSAYPGTVLRRVHDFTLAQPCAPRADTAAAVHAALARYFARRRGASAIAQVSAPAAGRLLHDVARAARELPRAARSRGLQIEGTLRQAVQRARSAGDLGLLEDLAARLLTEAPVLPSLAWLERARDQVERTLARPTATPDEASWRICAILIAP